MPTKETLVKAKETITKLMPKKSKTQGNINTPKVDPKIPLAERNIGGANLQDLQQRIVGSKQGVKDLWDPEVYKHEDAKKQNLD